MALQDLMELSLSKGGKENKWVYLKKRIRDTSCYQNILHYFWREYDMFVEFFLCGETTKTFICFLSKIIFKGGNAS